MQKEANEYIAERRKEKEKKKRRGQRKIKIKRPESGNARQVTERHSNKEMGKMNTKTPTPDETQVRACLCESESEVMSAWARQTRDQATRSRTVAGMCHSR